jgi:hypothetical protein
MMGFQRVGKSCTWGTSQRYILDDFGPNGRCVRYVPEEVRMLGHPWDIKCGASRTSRNHEFVIGDVKLCSVR